MRTVENFTRSSIGSEEHGQGTVARCPQCGRAGVIEFLADGALEFVHVETEEVMGDGMLVKPIDCCSVLA